MVCGRSGWPSFGGAFPIGTSRSWASMVRAWKPRWDVHGIPLDHWDHLGRRLEISRNIEFWSCAGLCKEVRLSLQDIADCNTSLLYTVGLISSLQTKGCHHSLPWISCVAWPRNCWKLPFWWRVEMKHCCKSLGGESLVCWGGASNSSLGPCVSFHLLWKLTITWWNVGVCVCVFIVHSWLLWLCMCSVDLFIVHAWHPRVERIYFWWRPKWKYSTNTGSWMWARLHSRQLGARKNLENTC